MQEQDATGDRGGSRRRFLVAGVAAAPTTLTGCLDALALTDGASSGKAAPMAGVDPARTGATTVTVDGAPSVTWRRSAGAPIAAAPVASSDAAVVGDLNGVVHRFDLGDGTAAWSTAVGRSVWGAPAIGDERVFVGDDAGSIRGLSLASGDSEWRIDDGAAVETPLAVANGFAYLAAGDLLCALRADGGRERWATDHRHLIEPSFALDRGTVYAVGAGSLVALGERSGEPLWVGDAGSGAGVPTVADGRVLVPERGGVSAYDAGDGQGLWTHPLDERPADRLAARDGLVLTSVGSRALAVDAADGTVRWERTLSAPAAAPTVAADVALFGTAGGDLVALAVADGREQWRVAVGGAIERPPAVTDRGAVVATADGVVHLLS